MIFADTEGGNAEFVMHGKRFDKNQCLKIFENEMKKPLKDKGYRKPEIEDVIAQRARFYVKAPKGSHIKTDKGFYSYSGEGRGTFPVWVIAIEDLKIEEGINDNVNTF
jgi:hypothetical protein